MDETKKSPITHSPWFLGWLGGGFLALFLLTDTLLDSLLYGSPLSPPHRERETLFRFLVSIPFLVYLLFVVRSARQRRELERELSNAVDQLSREKGKLEAVFAAIQDGLSLQDRQFRIVKQNDAHRRMSGGDHIGELCYHAYACSDDICPGCPVAAAIAEDRVVRIEKPGRPDSPVEFIEITASPIRTGEGEIIGALEIVRDITERKWSENALRLQNRFLQQLIDTIPSPVFYKNRDGIFLGCNQAFADCMGREREVIVGRTLPQLVPLELACLFTEKEAELLAHPGSQRFETVIPCASTGRPRSVLCSQATYDDEDGEVAGIVGVVVDIDEIRKAQARIESFNSELEKRSVELASVNHELEAYNYSFTHDLRNHLTRIISSAQLLQESCGDHVSPHCQDLLQHILVSAREIHELGEGMRVLFSVTRREVKRTDVHLEEICRSILLNLQMSEPSRRVEARIQPVMNCIGDPRLLRIMMENLIGNAWKYTAGRDPAVIEIGMEVTDGEVVVSIRDNGIGFDQSLADQLFLPFRRLPNALGFPGSGIGLATVSRIMERHGGRIEARGEPGAGAEFRLIFPR